MIRQLSFIPLLKQMNSISQVFVYTNRHEHVFEILPEYVASDEIKSFFMAKCNIVYMLVELMSKFGLVSQYTHIT